MKLLSLLAAVFITAFSFAQMTEGKVIYSMEYTTDNPDMAAYLGMMQGSKMEMSFLPGKSRADISMGTMGTVTTITDEKTNKSLMLMNMMGMKNAIETTINKDDKAPEKTEMPNYKVDITTETKEIAGYKCTKAIMMDETGNEVIMWFTKDITGSMKGMQYYNPQFPGFPMEFSTTQQGMNIKFTVTKIEKTVDKKSFDMKVPEGYTMKTEEELKKSLGQ